MNDDVVVMNPVTNAKQVMMFNYEVLGVLTFCRPFVVRLEFAFIGFNKNSLLIESWSLQLTTFCRGVPQNN